MLDHDLDQEAAIVRRLTGADPDAVTLVDIGGESRVHLVDGGRLVVKFPRDAGARAGYATEVAILAALGALPDGVQVPRPRWVDAEQRWYGYEGIAGTDLDEVAKHAGVGELTAIGRRVGTFLRHLHAVKATTARVFDVEGEIAQFQEYRRMHAELLAGAFDAAELRALDAFVDAEMPAEMRALGYDPVLCHGDLGFYNLVVGADGRIGVIDFADAGTCDRAKDFMGLSGAVLDGALEAYGEGDRLRRKVRVRARALPLLDIHFFSAKGGPDGVEWAVDQLRDALR